MNTFARAAEIMGEAFRPGYGSAAPAIGRDLAHLLDNAGILASASAPAPDSQWMLDLRDILESTEFDAVDKLEIIREMMPDDPHTFTF